MIINDPEFGSISYQGVWYGNSLVRFLGEAHDIQLIIETDDESGSIVIGQRAAYALRADYISQLENVLYCYYLKIADDYRQQFSDGFQRMPILDNVLDLNQVVKLTGIILPMVTSQEEVVIGFFLECNWDPEHGLAVKFAGSDVEVGSQDLLT